MLTWIEEFGEGSLIKETNLIFLVFLQGHKEEPTFAI